MRHVHSVKRAAQQVMTHVPFRIPSPHSSGDLPQTDPAADECPHGQAWEHKEACVVAVVTFNGKILAEEHNLTTYVSIGGTAAFQHSTLQTRGGVTVVRLPPAGEGTSEEGASEEGTLSQACVAQVLPQAADTSYQTVDSGCSGQRRGTRLRRGR